MVRSSKLLGIAMLWIAAAASSVSVAGNKENLANDFLVKMSSESRALELTSRLGVRGQTEKLGGSWHRLKLDDAGARSITVESLRSLPGVLYAQPNYKLRLLENPALSDKYLRESLLKLSQGQKTRALVDNPAIPMKAPLSKIGADPQFSKQWGMNDIGVLAAWKNVKTIKDDFVVAVIDTGVDYTHEDLVENMWRNSGEMGLDASGKDKSSNNVDDDGNGYVDDIVGWDFPANDNRPFDLPASLQDMLTKGGNPGHGTHCAGNVAARGNNSLGISGVAPNVKIMALKFITIEGSGTTSDAIKAIRYALDKGVKVLSNSWGSEGEDSDQTQNEALKDAIRDVQKAGALFVAAAGNGHQGKGYDNDTDAKPAYPASYDMDTIISVAALDSNNQLGAFSNWGANTVDMGAPGVKVFSTVPGNKYADTVINIGPIKATWDGTSMATPHVAGAAALYWSQHPNATWKDVKNALMNSVEKIPSMTGKSVSGGKLNVDKLMSLK
jgi:thermitase